MVVTKRETLLECLDIMQKIRKSYTEKGSGLAPIERYKILFLEYDEKCQILRELIQAMESEPVRKAMAEWQKRVMDQGPEALQINNEEQQLRNVRQLDIQDYTGNNGPLK